MGLDARLRTSKLALITDLRTQRKDLREFIVEALRGGVDMVQLRDSDASTEQLVEAVALVRSAANQTGALVAVSRNLVAAKNSGVDVLHLGAADTTDEAGRDALHEHALLGRSVHTVEEITNSGADHLFVGPVFGPDTALAPLPGLDLVRRAIEIAPPSSIDAKPWFAVGGIDATNLDQVLATGARRVAVAGAIGSADDPQAVATALKDRLVEAWNADAAMGAYALAAVGTSPHLTFRDEL